ncbi:lipid A phosphoethanolamine transferase [Escherichia coli]|nr:lipid A phosphoethanolamine transferase [Escherichia coli]
MSCIKEKSKYAFERAKQFYFMLWCKESLIYLLFSVLVTWCCGYTVKNTLGNVLILFLMLLLGRQNVISATCVCIFLLLSAFYAPVGMIYGKINNSFIASVMQTNLNEAGEFITGIPVLYFIVSLIIAAFTFWFWRKRDKSHRGFIFLLFFIVLSVNAWPKRMVTNVMTGIAETREEMMRYESLKHNQKDSWDIVNVEKKYKTIIIVIGESVRRDYLSVYGYPLPTTPWLNSAPGIFINGYFSAAPNTIGSLSRTLTLDYTETGNPGNNIVTLARKAGYETWWISNQGSLGRHDTLISVIAANADKKYFLKEESSSSRRIDDEDMLQYVREAVNSSSPKVIFIHMLGSHPNPCDRLFNDAQPFRELFGNKVSCYLSTLLKLDRFLQAIYNMTTEHGDDFAMLYFSDHGQSVSSDSTPVHHAPGLRSGYDVPLMMMASDITEHHLNHVHISARRFPEIFQWITGIQTKNLPLSFSLLQNDFAESVSVFNGERDVPVMSLPEEPILTGNAESEK